MKRSIVTIGLILATISSLTSSISSSKLTPPQMEFEEMERQFKAFLKAHPVNLSHHFAASCSYAQYRVNGLEQAGWALIYEHQTNRLPRLQHRFNFSPREPVLWNGHEEIDLKQCNQVLMEIGTPVWKFYVNEDGSLRFMKESDRTGGAISKPGAIPFEKVVLKVYENSTFNVPPGTNCIYDLVYFINIRKSNKPTTWKGTPSRFLQDLNICNELLEMAENKMAVSERQKFKPLWEEWKREFKDTQAHHQQVAQTIEPVSKPEALPEISLFEAAAKAKEFLQTQRTDMAELYLKTIQWKEETKQWESLWFQRRPYERHTVARVLVDNDGSCQIDQQQKQVQSE